MVTRKKRLKPQRVQEKWVTTPAVTLASELFVLSEYFDYEYAGCFIDNPDGESRALTDHIVKGDRSMTNDKCKRICFANGGECLSQNVTFIHTAINHINIMCPPVLANSIIVLVWTQKIDYDEADDHICLPCLNQGELLALIKLLLLQWLNKIGVVCYGTIKRQLLIHCITYI